jgi:putative spermidine/putrescine transport system permease protein
MMRLPGYAIGALWAMTGVVFLLLYSPLIIPIVSSFFAIAHGEVQWHDPSLASYAALTANRGILEAVGNTLIVGFSTIAAASRWGARPCSLPYTCHS